MSKEIFDKQGYLVLPNFLIPEVRTFASECFFISIIADKGIKGDDKSHPNSISFYGHPASEALLKNSASVISIILGEEVLPTYSYTRMYRKGDELLMHRDRPSCEVSLSLCLSYEEDKPPVALNFNKTRSKENCQSAVLYPGDACLYKGCEMWHWREKFVEHEWYLQTFLHYVRANGPNASCYLDGRKSLGRTPDHG